MFEATIGSRLAWSYASKAPNPSFLFCYLFVLAEEFQKPVAFVVSFCYLGLGATTGGKLAPSIVASTAKVTNKNK